MAICSANSYAIGFTSRFKKLPLGILKSIVAALINQDKKSAFIIVDEDGSLAIYFGFMRTYHNMNIIFQTTGGDSYSLNGNIEIPNKTLASITTALLLNSSHKEFFLNYPIII